MAITCLGNSWGGRRCRKRTNEPNGFCPDHQDQAGRTRADIPSLPWQDAPTAPGWYWYRLRVSPTVRGPVNVWWISKGSRSVLYGVTRIGGWHCHDGEGRPKRCDTFLRLWAGPLPRPEADP